MPAAKREHDPLRSAEVLKLLKKHEHSRSKSTVGPASRRFVRWCHERGLPEDVCSHFARCSIRGAEMSFGCGVLGDEKGIIDWHKRDTQLLAAALLEIGSCPNGDLVVMDLKAESFPIGFISHEHYWAPTPPPPRQYLVRVADSLYDFLSGWDDDTLPGDYFEASRGT